MQEANKNNTLNTFLNPKYKWAEPQGADLLHFLICQDGYEDHLKQYLEILYSVYPMNNGQMQIDLLTKLLKRQEEFNAEIKFNERCRDLFHGKIQKVLIILRNLGRNQLLSSVFYHVHKIDPTSLDTIYQTKKPTERGNMQSLLERDSARMTRLHRAVYCNDTEVVGRIFDWVINNKNNPQYKQVAEGVVDCVARDDYAFTPFYVAFVCGHEDLCRKIMQFLNRVVGCAELINYLTSRNGFLHRTLLDALVFEKIDKFEMLLANVKEIFGHELIWTTY